MVVEQALVVLLKGLCLSRHVALALGLVCVVVDDVQLLFSTHFLKCSPDLYLP